MKLFSPISVVYNTFHDAKSDLSNISELEVLAIDSYLATQSLPEDKPTQLEWGNYGSYEKLASIIARECLYWHSFQDITETLINKEDSMLFVYNAIMEIMNKVSKKIWLLFVKQSGYFFFRDTPPRLDYAELPSLAMKHLFIQLSDHQNYSDDISVARFEYWRDYHLGKVYIEHGKSSSESETSFRGIDLKSPGHKLLCEKLNEMGYMFFFEAPCVLLGDSKRSRRIDLVVIANNRAVIVEIDGGTHRTVNQQRDDYNRDNLIRKNWTNTLRLDHGEVINNTDLCIQKIVSYLDPNRGRIA